MSSRASLNLGHTIAHAIEAIASNECEDVTHGETVAWGLVFALECSTDFLGYEEEWRDRYIEMIIEGINAPITLHSAEQMWEVMLTDKLIRRLKLLASLEVIRPIISFWQAIWQFLVVNLLINFSDRLSISTPRYYQHLEDWILIGGLLIVGS